MPKRDASHHHQSQNPDKRKHEIQTLRLKHMQLLDLLRHLQSRKSHDDAQASQWKLIARYEASRKHQALQENAKLRVALREHQQLQSLLQKLCGRVDPVRQTMGSVEDFEWKVNVLSRHPERRRYNADMILNGLYGSLPTRAIHSGLFHVKEPTRFSKTSNVDVLDQHMFQEVNLCAFCSGHFLAIAESCWQATQDLVTLGDNAFALCQVTETFDESTSYWTATTYFGAPASTPPSPPTPSLPLQSQSQEPAPQQRDNTNACQDCQSSVGPVTRYVSRFVKEGDSCVTSFFTNVRETHHEALDKFNVAENVSGWFTLQDGGVDGDGQPRTLFKCSISAQLPPITHRLHAMVALANRLHLGPFPDPTPLEYSARRTLERQVRRALAHFLEQILWTHLRHEEANIARHAACARQQSQRQSQKSQQESRSFSTSAAIQHFDNNNKSK